MEIKVGRKYKRVKMSGVSCDETFIGQVVTVLFVKAGGVHYEKLWRSGVTEGDCAQSIRRFSDNFKPLIVSLENK